MEGGNRTIQSATLMISVCYAVLIPSMTRNLTYQAGELSGWSVSNADPGVAACSAPWWVDELVGGKENTVH